MIDWLGLFGLLMLSIVCFVFGYILRGQIDCLNDTIRIMKDINHKKIVGGYQPQKDCGFLSCDYNPPKNP